LAPGITNLSLDKHWEKCHWSEMHGALFERVLFTTPDVD
jgi:hypothetical protein